MTNSDTMTNNTAPLASLSPDALKKLAEKGDPDAQVAYADHLQRSWGSKEEQMKWLSKSYMQGNVIAAWKLGCLYEERYEDNETAMVWYERAAEQGFSIAMMSIVYHYIARLQYDSHEELLAGYETAYAWLIKATQTGSSHAYRTFADFCFFGIQMDPDPAQAIRYYERAAENGDDIACVMLCHCYKHGKGTAKNKEKVKYWFGKCRFLNQNRPLRHHMSGWKKVAKRYHGSYRMDVRKYVL